MQSSFSPVKSNFRARSCHLVSWAIPPRTEDCRVGPSSPTSTWDIPTWFDSLIAHSATATQMFRPLLTPSLSNAKKKKKLLFFLYNFWVVSLVGSFGLHRHLSNWVSGRGSVHCSYSQLWSSGYDATICSFRVSPGQWLLHLLLAPRSWWPGRQTYSYRLIGEAVVGERTADPFLG